MIKILDSKIKNFDAILDKLLSKRKNKVQLNSVSVAKIIKDIKKNGDKAVLKYEKRFNKNNIIIPSSKQIAKSIKSLDKKVKKAIDLAYNRIYKFHSLQKFKNISYTDKLQNKLEYKYVPIESVAIYVPGSTASYPSSVLMNAIPALVAGVKRIIMINPGYKGKQNPAVLYAARKCKIKEIYSIGGPSAIAAVAYGTEAHDIDYALNRALDLFYDDREKWTALQANCMSQDWSWNRPALDYIELYHAARKN